MNNKKTITALCIILCIALAVLVILLIGINKKYIVSFNTAGGSNVPSQTIKRGELVSKPTDPTKEGYTFVRWDLNHIAYNFSSPVKQNMTLTAVWEKVVELTKYVITFNLDKETKTLEVTDFNQIDLDKLGFEEKNGYVIKWYLNDKEYDFTTPITADLKLTGKYEKATTFTVKFNTDGGSNVVSQTINKDEKVKEPSSKPTKYGYIFDGWYLNNKKYDFDTPVTSNITLIAKWKEDSNVKRFIVTFNNDGKTTKQTVLENNKVSQPTSPSKTGYKFDGWYLNNKKYDFSSKVTSNITLVAKYTELAKYTVTFNSDGGSNVASQTVYEGSKANKPSNPTKSGFVFKEWQLDNKTYNFDSNVTKNITLKAIWEKEKAKYTVTFNSDGGSNVASQTITEGEKASKPSNPTRSGYTFKEWQLNGRIYDFNASVSSNITLTAVWEEIQKNYTFSVGIIDEYSPDRTITVYEEGNKISFASIEVNGVEICSGGNCTVNKYEIDGVSTITVVLNSGKSVTAKKG